MTGSGRPRERFLVIHNPVAGMRRRWFLREVCRKLEAAGATVRLEQANNVDEDARLAQAAIASGSYDAVLAAGGDSTIRGVARGLIGSDMPLGVIPIGTGNVLAHELGLRCSPAKLAERLMNRESVTITLGLINDEPFLQMAGAGFDARVLSGLDVGWKRRLGKLAYFWPVARELVRPIKRFRVSIDGAEHTCSWLVVANGERYGGPFTVARSAHLQDGTLKAVVMRPPGRIARLAILREIASGRIALREDVTVLDCQRVAIPDAQNVLVQVDGEIAGRAPVVINAGGPSIQAIASERFSRSARAAAAE